MSRNNIHADQGLPFEGKSDRLAMLLSDRHGCYYMIGMNVIGRSPCVGIRKRSSCSKTQAGQKRKEVTGFRKHVASPVLVVYVLFLVESICSITLFLMQAWQNAVYKGNNVWFVIMFFAARGVLGRMFFTALEIPFGISGDAIIVLLPKTSSSKSLSDKKQHRTL